MQVRNHRGAVRELGQPRPVCIDKETKKTHTEYEGQEARGKQKKTDHPTTP